MQAFVPRSYLTPVRDEEAESQRKAKSRHARQTRRSTQGVTLTDLKEAQKTISLSLQDRQTEDGDTLDERSCLRKSSTDDRRVRIGLTESEESSEISPKWSKMDEQGNIEHKLETLTECPVQNLSFSSTAGSCGLLFCNNTSQVGERWRRDENENPVEGTACSTFATKQQQRRRCCDVEGSHFNTSQVIPRVDLSRHKPLQLFPSALALCSTSPYPPSTSVDNFSPRCRVLP
ncbi:protein phosphatase 1 regulatory subunit 12A-like [Labrus bergylta]|uniref:protein phosphatase 1 regulatory subunit 12A-like n=1 Tax=Labrus bergylta TaxID=56723 RepID=UPI00331347E7